MPNKLALLFTTQIVMWDVNGEDWFENWHFDLIHKREGMTGIADMIELIAKDVVVDDDSDESIVYDDCESAVAKYLASMQ